MVEFEEKDGSLICRFSGRMDTTNSLAVEDEVFDEVLRRRLPTVFDLEDVSFVSSAFYRICLKTARATKEMRISVTNTKDFIKDGFRITGLDKILDIK